jgi:hypothetical protein
LIVRKEKESRGERVAAHAARARPPFWEEARFRRLVEETGYVVADFHTDVFGTTGGEPTTWLVYFLDVVKT